MNPIDTIRTSVLSRIKPKEPERQKLAVLADSLISKINSIGISEGLNINAILVGSTARGTWL